MMNIFGIGSVDLRRGNALAQEKLLDSLVLLTRILVRYGMKIGIRLHRTVRESTGNVLRSMDICKLVIGMIYFWFTLAL